MKLIESVKFISCLKENAVKMVKEVHESGKKYIKTQNGHAKAVLFTLIP